MPMLPTSNAIDRLVNPAWQRFLRNAPKLIAATLFTGTAAGIYLLTPTEAGPFGATILAPGDNATLTEANDSDHDCSNGFQTTVSIRTNAPDGTPVAVTANGLLVAQTLVSGHQVTLPGVQLGSSEDHVLVAQVGPTRALSSVHVKCSGAPKCRLLGPTWTPEHPRLNTRRRGYDLDAGVDASDAGSAWIRIGGGDRTSGNGSPYQFSVDLETGLSPGGRIEPFVDSASQGAATKTTLGSQDRIDGVPMPAEGQHAIAIKCTQGSSVGWSTRALMTVDTAPPQASALTVADGYHFPASMILPGGKIRVCASSVSPDAVDLPADMGDGRDNFCAAVGTSSPVCAPMSAQGADPAYPDGGLPESGSVCDGAAGCMCPNFQWCAQGQDASVSTVTGAVTCWLGSTAVSTNNALTCSGCPSGTTLSPTAAADLFDCLLPDGGKVWSGLAGCTGQQNATLPDGGQVGISPSWDAACFSCPNDGGAACLLPWNAGIDGGCRECQYVQPDGAVRHSGWQCPWCDDTTKARSGACVEIACPGPAAFSLRLSVYDSSRNLTEKIVSGVTCEVAGPSIEIVDPIGGSVLEILEDINKRVLAASTTSAPRRDIDPVAPGAQYDVIACTDAPPGSSAELLAGPSGGAIVRIATAVVSAPDAAGVCGQSSSKQRQIRFAGATLPESGEDAMGRLRTATRLRAAVTVGSVVSIAPDVDVWVDSKAPEMSWQPGFCGQHFATVDAASAAARKARARVSSLPVTIQVVNEDGTRSQIVTELAPEQYQ